MLEQNYDRAILRILPPSPSLLVVNILATSYTPTYHTNTTSFEDYISRLSSAITGKHKRQTASILSLLTPIPHYYYYYYYYYHYYYSSATTTITT